MNGYRLLMPHRWLISRCATGGFGPDLDELAATFRLSSQEVIRIIQSCLYRVYDWFCPGFSLSGRLDERLITPRRKAPRRRSRQEASALPIDRPAFTPGKSGGWQIIGRTRCGCLT